MHFATAAATSLLVDLPAQWPGAAACAAAAAVCLFVGVSLIAGILLLLLLLLLACNCLLQFLNELLQILIQLLWQRSTVQGAKVWWEMAYTCMPIKARAVWHELSLQSLIGCASTAQNTARLALLNDRVAAQLQADILCTVWCSCRLLLQLPRGKQAVQIGVCSYC